MINNIQYAVNEARAAAKIAHPGLTGRIRELAAEKIFRPILPAAFAIGTGKIVDQNTTLSSEVDLVIYNRDLLPPIMYSERDGIFPIESTYYGFEIKSESNATNMKDAIGKRQQQLTLHHTNKDRYPGNNSPVVWVFFAFDSDLSPGGKSEFARYRELDPSWKDDPIIRVMCIVGRGYWYFSNKKEWIYQRATDTYDEVLILLSQTVNTLMPRILSNSRPKPLFGDYLRPPDVEPDTSEIINQEDK